MKYFLKIFVNFFWIILICGNVLADDFFPPIIQEVPKTSPSQPFEKNKMWSDLNERSKTIKGDMAPIEKRRNSLKEAAEAKWEGSQLPGFKTQSKAEYVDSYMNENGFSGTYPNYSTEQLDNYNRELTSIQDRQKIVEKITTMSDEEKAKRLSELEADRDRSLKEAESKWEQGKTTEELKNTDAKAMFVNGQMKEKGYTGTYPSYSNFDLDVFQNLSALPNPKDMTDLEINLEENKLEKERKDLLKEAEEKWNETPEGQKPKGNTPAELDDYYAKQRAFIIKYMKDHGYNFRDSLYGSKSYRALFDVQYYDNDRLNALKNTRYSRVTKQLTSNTNGFNPQLDSHGRIYNSHTNTTVVIPYDIAPKVQTTAPSLPTPPSLELELVPDEFKTLYDVIHTNFPKARLIVYLFSGFGLIAVSLMAIFGKMRLQWLIMITVSLFLLASTEAIISYSFNAGKGEPSTLTAKQAEDMFNYGSEKDAMKYTFKKNADGSTSFSYSPTKVKTKENNLTLREDSDNFNYEAMKAQGVSEIKNTYVYDLSKSEKNKDKLFFHNFQILFETLVNLRVIVYVLSCFALVGLAFLAIMGRLDWALFSVIALSLFVLSGTEALINYAYKAATTGNPKQITAQWANQRFNNGTSEQLNLRDDSKDFDYLKSDNKRETPVKTKNQVEKPSWVR